MGFYLLPVAVLTFFIGIFAIERNHAQDMMPQPTTLQAEYSGQTFIAYRNAVSIYQQTNPTYIGTVSNAMLAALGSQFSAPFLASAGNAITATGTSGRVITSYAALPPGSITTALTATQNDASLGIASGLTWTSYAQGISSTPVTLATAVPNGDVVSVIQIGN
jgi:hypothetical protein